MSIREKYDALKLENVKKIVLVKSGNFYVTFADDAQILSNLLNYKVIKERLGFPLGSLDKVVRSLTEENFSFIVVENDKVIVDHSSENNGYDALLKKVKKNEFTKAMNKILLDRIAYLIESDIDNYEKIKRFIDEL